MVRSSRGRRAHGKVQGREQAGDRDADTITAVNELLLAGGTAALTQLRKIAAIRGLVNDGLRARVWPLLVGAEGGGGGGGAAEYAERHARGHKDSHVVACDMARSLWGYTEGWGEAEREAKRRALRRVVEGALGGNEGGLHYYQGLHDVAAVLLFVCGEAPAYRLLRRLAAGHLRDCTRPDLAAATETLRLLYPILQQCDPELHAYLLGLQEPALEVPYFALSWYITWFAHEHVPELPQVARLFDLFLASHPLMPLYVAAVALKGNRRQVLACGDDGLAAYAALKRMRFLRPGQPDADQLAREAAAMYQALPPAALAARRGIVLQHSAAIHAYLSEGRWHVPPEPRAPRAPLARATAQQLAALFGLAPGQGRGAAALAAVVTSVTGLAALGAILLAQMQAAQWGR